MFDTITLNHVLEHIEDPFEILSNLKTLLKDNGTIIAKYLELPVTSNGKIKKLRKIYQEEI